MSNWMDRQYSINGLEAYAQQSSKIHDLNSTLKIIGVIIYLMTLASYSKWEIIALMPMALLLYVWLALGNIPLLPLLKRLIFVEPLLIGIGILNPFFDKTEFFIGTMGFSTGWLVFLSLIIRGSLSVLMVFALISTTGMNELSKGLRRLGLPNLFILQLLMTYRYIGVLMEEAANMTIAYHLRAPHQKGIALKHMGSFVGQLLLRTIERSERIYAAMKARGFNGSYTMGPKAAVKMSEVFILGLWVLCLGILRIMAL